MWQIYICDEDGETNKPLLKPFNDYEKAEEIIESLGFTPYEIRRVWWVE